MAYRIFLTILLLLSVMFMPFWVSLILMLIGMAYFPIYWEAVLVFLLSDFLYGVERTVFYNIVFVSTLFSLLTLTTVEVSKKKLKFYPNN